MPKKHAVKQKKARETAPSPKPPVKARRLALTLFFTAIFALRIPDLILNPQFWAEDATVFFRGNLCEGTAAISKIYEGYYHLVPRLIAFFASAFAPRYQPALYVGTTIAITAAVSYMVQSPRIQLPFLPALALAMVLTPAGLETFGNITNVQWFLALGLVAILLMEATPSRLVVYVEASFVVLAGLTGPFALLLVPMFVVRLVLDWKNRAARQRALVLVAVAAIAAAIQSAALVSHPVVVVKSPETGVDIPLLVGLAVFTHTLGPPLSAVSPNFAPGPSNFMTYGWVGLAEIAVVLLIGLNSLRSSRLRFERFLLLYSGFAVFGATLFKFRHSMLLLVYPGNGTRYFLIPTVISCWLMISAVQERRIGLLAKASLALVLVAAIPEFRRDPLVNYDWPMWARKMESGSRPKIPINPPGWSVQTDCSLVQ